MLGPEMRSTGEVMGIDVTFGLAFAKARSRRATGCRTSGTVFLSLADRDKPPASRRPDGFVRARLRHRGDVGHRGHLEAAASRCTASWRSSARTASTRST